MTSPTAASLAARPASAAQHAPELIMLAAVWGGSFAFYRYAVPEFGAVWTVFLRLGIAGAALWLLFGNPLRQVAAGQRTATLGYLTLVGALNATLPYLLFARVVTQSSASLGSVLNATAPFFTALLTATLLRRAPSGWVMAGLALGIGGVTWLALGRSGGQLQAGTEAIALGLLASAMYAVAATVTRQKLSHLSGNAVATGATAFGAVLLLPVAPAFLPAALPGTQAWVGLLGLALASTAFAYVLYFRLIARIGSTQAIAVTFLIPLFGILWGVLLFSEPLTLTLLGATVLILAGMALVMEIVPGRPGR